MSPLVPGLFGDPPVPASQLLTALVQGCGVLLKMHLEPYATPLGRFWVHRPPPRSAGHSAGTPASQGCHTRDAQWPKGRRTHLRPGDLGSQPTPVLPHWSRTRPGTSLGPSATLYSKDLNRGPGVQGWVLNPSVLVENEHDFRVSSEGMCHRTE